MDLLKAYNESSIDERDDALSNTTSDTRTLEPNIRVALADLSHRKNEHSFPLAACLKYTALVMPSAFPTKDILKLSA
jgi:predicted deacetylase